MIAFILYSGEVWEKHQKERNQRLVGSLINLFDPCIDVTAIYEISCPGSVLKQAQIGLWQPMLGLPIIPIPIDLPPLELEH